MNPFLRTLSFFAMTILSISAAERIDHVSIVQGTGVNTGINFVVLENGVLPTTNYIMESSSDLVNWGPASPLLSSGTNTLTFETTECAGLNQRFYRFVRQYGSYSSTLPVGRLTRGPFLLTTVGGWEIRIDSNAIRFTEPGTNHHFFEVWGSVHENFKGKHIKDFLSDRRSFILTDGTQITLSVDRSKSTAGNPMGWLTFVSIYDGNESHRINMQDLSVDRSSKIARYGEADEFDGETARFRRTEDGFLFFENIYDESDPCSGLPSQKVFNTVPLSRADDANPNQVNDYFDDPRLGHT